MKILKFILFSILISNVLNTYSQDTINAKFHGLGGFQKYLPKHMMYPNEAAANGISGNVEFKIKIRTDGCIEKDSIIILSSPDIILSNEVIRAIKTSECKWTPSKIGNKPVTSWYKACVNFTL